MKKIFSILLTASLFMGLSTTVSATTDDDQADGLQLVVHANVEIDNQIEKAVEDADKLQENFLLEVGNLEAEEEIAALTNTYNVQLDKIIAEVYDVTLQTSNDAIAEAAEYGIEAECSWVLVEFADRSVWIDPIRVIGRN
ncbi:hypothetical protein [Paenisporosarcina sp.]|uniref:hypothetical protein n=1 Tax=Paenisporosarcina sp. TaxID=1932001 RepID=UPI003C712DFC